MLKGTEDLQIEPELDLYWIHKAGMSPIEYMRRYAGRTSFVHLKDMDVLDGSFAEVGYGSMHYPEILSAAMETGVRYGIVEQDACKRPPLESVQMSFDYLKNLRYA